MKQLLIIFLLSLGLSLNAQKSPSKIPHFKAYNQENQLWSFPHDLKSDFLVVYFYPAAMTGGCTKQACAYRDNLTELKGLNASIIAVSGDDTKGLKLFQKAHNLNFELLSDAKGKLAEVFGVPMKHGGSITRMIDNQEYILSRSITTARWTFIINKEGEVLYRNKEVKAASDSEHIIQVLKSL